MSWIRRETEKGTVQYICPRCHDYHEFREDFGERTFSENYIFCRRCGARNGTGNAPTLTPPNEPLMLEELREMDGDPVWFDTIKRWGIVIVRSAEVSVLTKSGEFDVTRLKFYRRPPEGEEEEKHVIEITENL